MTFGERLFQLRNEHGLRQEDIGKIVGVVKSAVSQWESGGRTPDPNTLQRLADYFKVTVDYLLGRTNTKNSSSDNNDDPELEALFRDLRELDANDRAIIMAIARERKKQRERKEKEDKEST